MNHLRILCVVFTVLLGARPSPGQGFDMRQRSAAPLAWGPWANSGVALDIDQSGSVDVLLKGGSVLVGDGHLGFAWSPPGQRIPTVGLIPPGFDLVTDVDGDGRPDLVALRTDLSFVSTTVYVNHGLPNGYWAPRVVVGTAPGFAGFPALVDIDGDGASDIAFTQFWPTQAVGLLRNLGNGTYGDVTATHLPSIAVQGLYATTDVTGDGAPDLLVRANGATQLLVNNGAGMFTPAASGLPTIGTTIPTSTVTFFADADADGDPDLLLATASGSPMQLWLGSGSGTFTQATTTMPTTGTGHAFVDLDGDQRADLLRVQSTPLGQRLEALRNVGGQFVSVSVAAVDVTMAVGDPIVADLDQDGDLDAIVGGTLFFLHDGNLGFVALQRQPIEYTVGTSVVAGDIDGDEFADLVVGETQFHNQGDGYFDRIGPVLPAGGRASLLVDLDLDDDLDLVWSKPGTQNCGVMLNHLGTFTPQPLAPGLVRGRTAATDFDGDGLPDLVSESQTILRNLGGGAFSPAASLPPTERFLTTCDFDADGLIDILCTSTTGSVLWRNLGGFAFQATATPWPFLAAATTGDFDGNGHPDLAAAYLPSGSTQYVVQIWFQHPPGWTPGPSQNDGLEAPTTLVAADFDDDGDLDLLGRNLWNNTGGGSLAILTWLSTSVFPVAVADLDGDRDLDFVRSGTGAVSTTRHLVFMNQLRDLDANRMPILGHPYSITLASRAGTGIGGDLVLVALATNRIAPLSLPGLGLLQIDPQSIVGSDQGLTANDGLKTFSFALPPIPALAGIEVYWQGVIGAPSGLRFTSLLIDRLLF